MSDEHPLVVETGKRLQFVVSALMEGGLSREHQKAFNGDWFAKAHGFDLEKNQFHIALESERGNRLVTGLRLPQTPDDEEPAWLETFSGLVAGSVDSPALEFTRRTGRGLWIARAVGTLSLPRGHALRELAHGERHLNLGANHMEIELEDRDVFLNIMKIARIFERNEL